MRDRLGWPWADYKALVPGHVVFAKGWTGRQENPRRKVGADSGIPGGVAPGRGGKKELPLGKGTERVCRVGSGNN